MSAAQTILQNAARSAALRTFLTLLTLLTFLTAPPANAQAPATNDGLKTVLAPDAKLEKVSSGFAWTEGPVYERKSNSVLFSDQPSSTLNRFDCASGKTTLFRGAKVVPNGNTFDAQGRLVGCEHTPRRVARTEAGGEIVTLAYLYNNKRLNSPNDVVIKSDGAVYFTDPPYGLPNLKVGKELDVNGVFRVAPSGDVTLLTADLSMPNGLAFSPDEKTLYIDDSERKNLRAFAVNPDGTLGPDKVLATLDTPGKNGVPDGMKVDTRGTIYCTGAGGIWVIAPGGTVLGVIETPETAANCAFGDRDGKTLYITASSSLYRIRLRTAGRIPGVAK